MRRPALLDVNVLIALFDPSHIHHDIAHDWFGEAREDGWATCPLTELGFIRVLSNPAAGDASQRAASLVEHLRTFCASGNHHYWAATISLRDETLFDLSSTPHRQLTDVYLLGLARKMGGTLATFDRSIPVKAVKGATPQTLAVIAEVSE